MIYLLTLVLKYATKSYTRPLATMTWTFILIAFILYISLFIYNKHSKRKFNSWQKNSKAEFVNNVRENWKEIRIKTDDCIVINFDTKVNKNSPTYSLTNENETLYEWIERDPKRIDLIDLSRSKILCKYKLNGKTTTEFSTTVDMDKTVVEFKLRMRDFVSVYISEEFDKENYFIDLEFLNEEIDLTKFK